MPQHSSEDEAHFVISKAVQDQSVAQDCCKKEDLLLSKAIAWSKGERLEHGFIVGSIWFALRAREPSLGMELKRIVEVGSRQVGCQMRNTDRYLSRNIIRMLCLTALDSGGTRIESHTPLLEFFRHR